MRTCSSVTGVDRAHHLNDWLHDVWLGNGERTDFQLHRWYGSRHRHRVGDGHAQVQTLGRVSPLDGRSKVSAVAFEERDLRGRGYLP
jgi:hypothetical protein